MAGRILVSIENNILVVLRVIGRVSCEGTVPQSYNQTLGSICVSRFIFCIGFVISGQV